MCSIEAAELSHKLKLIFRDIIPEQVMHKVLKRFKSITNEEFDEMRIKYREDVNKLIEKLAELQNQPFHKSQTEVRHASLEVQMLLADRLMTVTSSLDNASPDNIISVPKDFGGSILYLLIESWEHKLLKKYPDKL